VGEILDGKYEIAREIGRGAMGVVYEALHLGLGRRVAIKTLLGQMGADGEASARFEREAQSASAIGHPNIIDIFDLGCTQTGLRYMVMELLAGKPLDAIMRRTPQLPIPLSIHIVSQVLSGLGAAHKNGIIHRDLKPENIFVIDSDERPSFVKIVDFGISKMVGARTAPSANTTRFAGTVAGVVLGTPLYMSPEQAIGQPLDQRTDIYSTGVVLYEMLCGRTPIEGQSYPEIMTGILKGNYPPPRSLRPEIPAALEAVIARALTRDVSKRFPSAAAMRAELTGSQEVTPSPITLTPVPAVHGTLAGQPARAVASSEILLEPAVPSGHGPVESERFSPPQDDLSPLAVAHPTVRTAPSNESVLPELDRPRRQHPSREHHTMVPEPPRPMAASTAGLSLRTVLIPVSIVLALGLGIAARYVFTKGRSAIDRGASHDRTGSPKITVSIEPKDATVKIDHIPITMGELPVDSEAPRAHLVSAAAPLRVTRRYTFTMSPGMHLTVRLGRTLGAPEPSDPPPLAAEIATTYPANPPAWPEIDGAFSKLARFSDCLSVTGALAAELRKSGRRARAQEKLGLCREVVGAGATSEAAMPELQSAAEVYLSALQNDDRPERLPKLAASVRAAFLAARATWQLGEVARQEQDEGRKPGWHMRRFALMAQAWFRARKASPSVGHAGEPQRNKLDEYWQALKSSAHDEPRAWEHLSGAGDFIQAAEELVMLAHGQGGRHATEVAALDACRKVLTSFDALILD
jgi:serine/threonine-protein kinase